MSVMRNVAAPFGISDPERPNVSTTVWRAVYNLDARTLFYDGVLSPHVFWVQAANLDYAEGAPVRKLEVVGRYDLANDVSDQFAPAAMFAATPASETAA
jgi:choloylglycine hydrolase